MAEVVTIARPYAEAVFRLGREKGVLADWSGHLAKLSAYAADANVAACLADPGLTAARKADLMKSLLGAAATGDVANFIDVLGDSGRLAALPEIAAFFETLKAGDEGIQDAVIHSAYPLDAAGRDRLLPMLEAHFEAKLRPAVEVDPDLIGGIKVVVGDRVLDRSVRASLDAMASALRT